MSIFVHKVRILWEGHKIWKNLPLKIWRYWVASNFKQKIFSNFGTFSEYMNFNIWHYSVTSNFKWKIFSNFVAFSEYPNFKVRIKPRPRTWRLWFCSCHDSTTVSLENEKKWCNLMIEFRERKKIEKGFLFSTRLKKDHWVNYLLQLWFELDDELSWLLREWE